MDYFVVFLTIFATFLGFIHMGTQTHTSLQRVVFMCPGNCRCQSVKINNTLKNAVIVWIFRHMPLFTSIQGWTRITGCR